VHVLTHPFARLNTHLQFKTRY